MRLFVASHNAHKLREIAQVLSGFEIAGDDPAGVEETASDFAGNALIKVRAIAGRHRGEWCMADDSGLEVACLGGAPGVRSARYAGEEADSAKNNALLLANMQGAADRRANFTCTIALVDPDGAEHVVTGKCFGKIALCASGAGGFGYDPLFVPEGQENERDIDCVCPRVRHDGAVACVWIFDGGNNRSVDSAQLGQPHDGRQLGLSRRSPRRGDRRAASDMLVRRAADCCGTTQARRGEGSDSRASHFDAADGH